MSDQPSQVGTPSFVPAPPEPEAATTHVVPPAPVRPGTSRLGGTAWVNVALAVALAIAIAGIGFAAGRMTAPASATSAGNGRTFGNGQFPGGGYFPGGFQGGENGNGGGFRGGIFGGGASIEGTVESVSGDTLTLKLTSGQTIQIALSGTTTYHSQAAASSSDVKTGGTVIVKIDISRGQGSGTTTESATDVTIVP